MVYKNNKLENRLNNLTEVHNMLSWQDVSVDLVTSLCGQSIGEGVYRSVYEYNLDDRYVIKIEPKNTDCNISEHILWDEIKGLCGDLEWVRSWFAPVKWISPNGKILVMERTYERPEKERPREVPAFFTDLKRDNWGWLKNGKFVCHDFGSLFKFIKYEKKMQRIHKSAWW